MDKEELYFESKDGLGKNRALVWTPDGEPVAVLQIVHGMSEHVDRYDDFARFLNSKGFAVVAEDHLGHGKSVRNGLYCYFCKGDAATVVVEDVHTLTEIAKEKFAGKPYFILGHSMGSFILRNYLCKYGKEVSGAIVMGTGMQPKALASSLKFAASLAGVFGYEKKPCEAINKMGFGTYLAHIENPKTPFDWLSRNEENVQKYIDDPLCGITFTANGFKTLAELIIRLADIENVKKMPKDLKILITSGEEDPVGEYGAGPKRVYDSYKSIGMENVDIKLYPSDRHEILNETDKDVVYADIYEWLKKAMG